ncbi:50S ribosomal protein L23 [Candidatus Saccharibacteria bacterium]|nr:50S ribosomal protein L23 [Candidatus Saccharibacteria bacterium]MBQ9016804.1 50S ribosomal protein L23 [Candidatus Saccharibacteria bacterium]
MATAKDTKTTVKKVEEKTLEKVTLFEITPRATEKTYAEQSKRTYVFSVPLFASKQQVKAAVEAEFKVTVTDVRVLTRKGKKTRYSKGKHQYPGTTFRRDHKFAYVTVKEGDKIPVFQEEEAKEEETKADKKAKKAEAKEAKKAEKAEKKGDK